MSIEESLASLIAFLRSGRSFESIIIGNSSEASFSTINVESILKWINSRLITSDCSNSYFNNANNSKRKKDALKVAQSLMAVYKLSNMLGCPMADCVKAVADSYSSRKRVNNLTSEVFAMPKATIKLLIALPFLTILTGQLLGANPILMIFTSAKGYVFLSIGMIFYAIGIIWVNRIINLSKNEMLNSVSNETNNN